MDEEKENAKSADHGRRHSQRGGPLKANGKMLRQHKENSDRPQKIQISRQRRLQKNSAENSASDYQPRFILAMERVVLSV